jgi:hypothetical protein
MQYQRLTEALTPGISRSLSSDFRSSPGTSVISGISKKPANTGAGIETSNASRQPLLTWIQLRYSLIINNSILRSFANKDLALSLLLSHITIL